MDSILELLHLTVDWLLLPVLLVLALLVLTALWDVGTAIGERWGGLQRLRRAGDARRAGALARRRIERADLVARSGPMLGLMGTLIPLGPGLAALGRGDVATRAEAVTVAFDTTVLGLLAGVVAFTVARLRRRWYDALLDELEAGHGG